MDMKLAGRTVLGTGYVLPDAPPPEVPTAQPASA